MPSLGIFCSSSQRVCREKIMQTAVVDTATTQTKVCKRCGVEKPLSEFYIVNRRWHLRVCKACTLGKMKGYHLRTWSERYRKYQEVRKQRTRRFYHDVLKPRNLTLYGRTTSPDENERHRARRQECKRATGYAKSEDERAKGREHFLLLRTKVITLYGGKCECCGETQYKMLTIDHKIKEPKEARKHGVGLAYNALREYETHGYPNNRYRLLCWNCNTSRGFHGYCPHEKGHKEHEYSGKTLKLEMISAYGGKCALCGETHWEFLTIDHIHGGGTRHRRETGMTGGVMFYGHLRKLGWPTDDYRLLCANCNCSVKTNRRPEEVEA